MKPISETLKKFRALAADLRAAAPKEPAPTPAAQSVSELPEPQAVPPTRLAFYESVLRDISQTQSGISAVRAIALRAQEALAPAVPATPRWKGNAMTDFETHPVGTGATLRAAEAHAKAGWALATHWQNRYTERAMADDAALRASEAREHALLTGYEEERAALVENASLRQRIKEERARAERAEAALAASEDAQALTIAYLKGLSVGKGALSAADLALKGGVE